MSACYGNQPRQRYCMTCGGSCRGEGTGCPNYAEAEIVIDFGQELWSAAEAALSFGVFDSKVRRELNHPKFQDQPRSPRPRFRKGRGA